MKSTNFKQKQPHLRRSYGGQVGQIPGDWEKVRLADIADVNPENVNLEDDLDFINYLDISSVGPRIIYGFQTISVNKAPSRAKRKIRLGDTLISTVRPNRKSYVQLNKLPVNPVASTGFAVVRPRNLDEKDFVHYVTTSGIATEHYTSNARGSAYPAVSAEQIRQFEIIAPKSTDERIKIGSLLSSLDQKIELNRKMNQTLEEIGKAIFKHWFVDFEFPWDFKNNKFSWNGKPYKSGGGKMVDSKLGEIPKGWTIAQLKDFGEIICGKTPPKKKSEYFGGDIPFIKIPDMHNQMFIVTTEDSLTQQGMDFQKQKSLSKNSICVSCIATVGLVCITSQLSQTNQQINSIIPDDKFYREYLYYTLSLMNKKLRDYASGGSATLNLNTGSFSKIYTLKPDSKALEFFSNVTSGLFEKVLTNEKENMNIAEMRDSLLPRLVSGRLRVRITN